jgi:hypothetical protein
MSSEFIHISFQSFKALFKTPCVLRLKLLLTDEQSLVGCLGLALSGMKVCVIIVLGAEAFAMRLGPQKQGCARANDVSKWEILCPVVCAPARRSVSIKEE